MGNCSIEAKMKGITCGICWDDILESDTISCDNTMCTYKICNVCFNKLDKNKGCPHCKSDYVRRYVRQIIVNGISYKDNNEGLHLMNQHRRFTEVTANW